MAPVQEWTWQHDKRGLIIRTTIGGGTSNERIFNAYLGYDPITKKASYLDIHDSETTYSGHITLEDGFVVFRFGRIGSGKVEWVERGKFTNINLWESALYSVKEGKESLAHSFKLSRKIAK